MSSPEVGSVAPNFSLEGVRLVDGEAVRSTYSLEGRVAGSLVLVFYPGDDTTVCTKQLCAYSSGFEQFTELGAEVWGISVQNLASHESFARKHQLPMPLLADDGKVVVKRYGLTRLGGLHTARSVFVIDAQGIVRWSDVRTAGVTYQKPGELVEVLSGLGS